MRNIIVKKTYFILFIETFILAIYAGLLIYNKNQYLNIGNIQIVPKSDTLKQCFACLGLLFLGFNFIWFFRRFILLNREVVICLVGIIFIISLPLFIYGVNEGHDLPFHLLRIEGIANELLNKQFPVRMQSIWMDGYGYPVSIYYGDFLLYFPALLRIFAIPAIVAYKIYVFFINTVTVLVSYFCFKSLFRKNWISLAVTFSYVAASYRLVDIFVRAAVGEYSIFIFLPCIVVALIKIYVNMDFSWRRVFLLVFGMSGIICTHVLSAEMVMVFIIIVAAIFIKKTISFTILKQLIMSAIITLAISAVFVIPFLDYYLNVSVMINNIIGANMNMIQAAGTYIGEYFAFFRDIFGGNSYLVSERMLLTPGLVLMSALIVAFIFVVYKKATKMQSLFIALSLLALLMASSLFPWNFLAQNSKIGNILSQVQFPWRYISIAIILLSILLGYLLLWYEKNEVFHISSKCVIACTISCNLIMTILFACFYFDGASSIFGEGLNIADISSYAYGGGEYLLTDTDTSLFSNQIVAENASYVNIDLRKGTNMIVSIETDLETDVIFPILNYKGYVVRDELGNSMPIINGDNNLVKVKISEGGVLWKTVFII